MKKIFYYVCGVEMFTVIIYLYNILETSVLVSIYKINFIVWVFMILILIGILVKDELKN